MSHANIVRCTSDAEVLKVIHQIQAEGFAYGINGLTVYYWRWA